MKKFILMLIAFAFIGYSYMFFTDPEFRFKITGEVPEVKVEPEKPIFRILSEPVPPVITNALKGSVNDAVIIVETYPYHELSAQLAKGKYDAVITSGKNIANSLGNYFPENRKVFTLMKSPHAFGIRKDVVPTISDAPLDNLNKILAAMKTYALVFKYPSPVESAPALNAYAHIIAKDGVDVFRNSNMIGRINFAENIANGHKLINAVLGEEASIAETNRLLKGKTHYTPFYTGTVSEYELTLINGKMEDIFAKLRGKASSASFNSVLLNAGYRPAKWSKPNIDDAPMHLRFKTWEFAKEEPEYTKTVYNLEKSIKTFAANSLRPAFNIFLCDFSRGMQDKRDTIISAILGSAYEENSFLALFRNPRDINVFIPFNHNIMTKDKLIYTIGYNDKDINKAIGELTSIPSEGGVNVYYPVSQALYVFTKYSSEMPNYRSAAYLLTDSVNTTGDLRSVSEYWLSLNTDFGVPPIYGISCEASFPALEELADYSRGEFIPSENCTYIDAIKKAFLKNIK